MYMYECMFIHCMYVNTVQPFNSLSSGPDVCQCLVVQIPIKHTFITNVACESGWQSGVRSCFMTGLPTH